MKRLDRERPFGQVYGLNGVDYEQDGRYFNRAGDPVNVDNTSPPVDEPAPVSIDDGSTVKPAEVVESPKPQQKTGQDFENMHHMQLKAAVKMFGGSYENRDQAISFLKGQKAA